MTSDYSKLCLTCLECCKYISFTINAREQTPYRDLLTRFYNARQIKMIPSDQNVQVLIPHVCPQLTTQGCRIYNSRPHSCKIYDGRMDPFLKDKCKWPKGE